MNNSESPQSASASDLTAFISYLQHCIRLRESRLSQSPPRQRNCRRWWQVELFLRTLWNMIQQLKWLYTSSSCEELFQRPHAVILQRLGEEWLSIEQPLDWYHWINWRQDATHRGGSWYEETIHHCRFQRRWYAYNLSDRLRVGKDGERRHSVWEDWYAELIWDNNYTHLSISWLDSSFTDFDQDFRASSVHQNLYQWCDFWVVEDLKWESVNWIVAPTM